ncbi:MAG: hypothetical protein ACYC6J_09250 [Coriobacteriia bacterium]
MKEKTDYSQYKELIQELYIKENKNKTHIAKRFSELIGTEYSDGLRRNLSRFISNNIDIVDKDINTLTSSEYKTASEKKFDKNKKRFLITYVQEHTPIHEELFENMVAYANYIDADIHCIAGVYSNNNSKYDKNESTWNVKVIPYLDASRHKIHKYLCVLSDVNILPTAERPIRGFESLTGEESSIIGHPRQHLEVIPTLPSSQEKLILTTGALTIPNYRKSRVGSKAEFHHTFGFVIIEIDDENTFIPRQVSVMSDGSFMDCRFSVKNGIVKEDATLDAIILGDVHLGKHDEAMLEKTEELMSVLKPKKTIVHDLFDGYSVNHHASKDFIEQVYNYNNGLNDLRNELQLNLDWLEKWKKWNIVIVPSNHNEWIDRWVRFRNGKSDIANAIIFNEFENVLFNNLAPKGLYAYYIDKHFKGEVKTLHRDDSFKVLGWELNNHGDLGSNGAKASPLTFRKLNVKIISGDKHFIYKLDGAIGVGVSTHKKHGYNKGLSSWVNAHVGIHTNGKAQHFIYRNNKFTTL